VPNRLKLTDLSINALKTDTTTWDTLLPAFGVRVGKHAKTFIVIQDGGRRIKLGRYPEISLAEARKKARLVLSGEVQQLSSLTARDALNAYETVHLAPNYKPATAYRTVNLIQRHFAPLMDKPLEAIKTEQILALYPTMTQSNANHLHDMLRTFFNWARHRKMITVSPLTDIELPYRQTERDRILSDIELVTLYRAATAAKTTFSTILLLAIHTGLRRANIAELEWDWVSDDLITFPAKVMKTAQPFLLPNLIGDILAQIPRTGRYVFPSENGTPFSGFSKGKLAFDKTHTVTGYTLHDCRRTFRTNLTRWNCCNSEIAEMLLAHQVGSKIRRTYDRYSYQDEKREAMLAYETHLKRVLQIP
jgi:integrase